MSQPCVLVCGSLHLDTIVTCAQLPVADETVMGNDAQFKCGGKGCNQAMAAAGHGCRVLMLGRVGADDNGARLRNCLEQAGVDLELLQTDSDKVSGMSIAIVDESGDYGAVIVPAASRNVQVMPDCLPDDVALVVLQNEVPPDANLKVAAAAKRRKVPVLLNYAPAIPAAPELLEVADYLVLNKVEAGQLANRQIDSADDAIACVDAVRRHDKQTVIVTLGEQGLVMAKAGAKPSHQPACKAQVVSTHGAGDMFVGSLAARLAQGDSLADAASYAQRAAADAVSGKQG